MYENRVTKQPALFLLRLVSMDISPLQSSSTSLLSLIMSYSTRSLVNGAVSGLLTTTRRL